MIESSRLVENFIHNLTVILFGKFKTKYSEGYTIGLKIFFRSINFHEVKRFRLFAIHESDKWLYRRNHTCMYILNHLGTLPCRQSIVYILIYTYISHFSKQVLLWICKQELLKSSTRSEFSEFFGSRDKQKVFRCRLCVFCEISYYGTSAGKWIRRQSDNFYSNYSFSCVAFVYIYF